MEECDKKVPEYRKILAPIPEGERRPGFPSRIMPLLDENVEKILEMIQNGKSFRKIAKKFDVSITAFNTWRFRSKHFTRIEEAMANSAEAHAELSFKVLQDGIDSGTENMAEVQLRREMAQGHRWMAKLRSPQVFGDKKEITHNINPSPVSDDQFKELLGTVVQVSGQIENKDNESEYTEFQDIQDGEVPTD